MQNRKNVVGLLVAAVALLAMPVLAQTKPAAGPETIITPIQTGTPAPTAAPAGSPAAGQAADANSPGPAGPKPPPSFFEQYGMFLLLGVVLVFFLMTSRSRKKQESKRKEMINNMKKGDRVTTIGGIIGTIIEVKENEIVVKVDEQNNVRMHFVPSAIHTVGEAKTEEKK